jgi:hypothetical protein
MSMFDIILVSSGLILFIPVLCWNPQISVGRPIVDPAILDDRNYKAALYLKRLSSEPRGSGAGRLTPEDDELTSAWLLQ